MAASSKLYPAPHEKVLFLCREAGARGGKLLDLDDVVPKTSIKKTQFYALFGSANKSGTMQIGTKHVLAVTLAFKDDGYILDIVWWDLDLPTFQAKCREANTQAASAPKALPAPSPAREEPADLPSAAWSVTRAESHTEIAEAALHPPRPLNSRPDCAYLDVTFRCDIEEYSYKGRDIAVGLREAVLSFELTGCQFAANSLLGEADRKLEGVTVGKSGITVKAAEGEMLQGAPLQGHYIAELEPVGTALPAVSLTVVAPERGVTFAFFNADGGRGAVQRLDDANKDIILNLIYSAALPSRTDTRGRLRLADSKVEKKPECSNPTI